MSKQTISSVEKSRVESVMIDFTLPSTITSSEMGIP